MGRFKKWISIPEAYDEVYRKEKRFPVWYRLDKEHPNLVMKTKHPTDHVLFRADNNGLVTKTATEIYYELLSQNNHGQIKGIEYLNDSEDIIRVVYSYDKEDTWRYAEWAVDYANYIKINYTYRTSTDTKICVCDYDKIPRMLRSN